MKLHLRAQAAAFHSIERVDYSQSGAYFVTLCTHQRKGLFGDIVDGEMRLNEVGKIARDQWFQLTKRFPNISLDEFNILPNHMHAILWIMDSKDVGAGLAPARDGYGIRSWR